MKQYFSTILCSSGYCSAYNTIYKRDPTAKIFVINGDDYERSVFFSHIESLLRGYNITLFNPFYDEAIDGIYIENINTYILSDGGYNKIMPVLPGIWEKYFDAVENKHYSHDLIREVMIHKTCEKNFYRTACSNLKKASVVKERLHAELSVYLNEDKIVKYVHRLFLKEFKIRTTEEKSKIHLLSSPTPLGIHTHYDTIFEISNRIINIIDETDFMGSIILGVVKNYAIQKKIGIIASPTYFNNDFFQFLIFPQLKLCLCLSDKSHTLPFRANETITCSQFLTNASVINSEKIRSLLSVENKLLEKTILSIYDGREERFKYNSLVNGYSKPDEAKLSAEKLTEKLLN